jgi:hypothetical protein
MNTQEKATPVTYFVGADVLNPFVQETVQKITNKARGIFGLGSHVLETCKMTVIPPFTTSHEEVFRISKACEAASLFPKHPFVKTCFQVRHASIAIWKHSNILYFPVSYQEGSLNADEFKSYILKLREVLMASPKFIWDNTFPQKHTPYLAVLNLRGMMWNEDMQKLVQKSRELSPSSFFVSHPKLYIKDGDVWRHFPRKARAL